MRAQVRQTISDADPSAGTGGDSLWILRSGQFRKISDMAIEIIEFPRNDKFRNKSYDQLVDILESRNFNDQIYGWEV